ncbi:MAG: rhodanese-like domain-containing protein [Desulfobulbaceae bacterium]|nr:rhodanese-like domain-containing protein [Desulfobulbaceae bacterium]
MKKLLCVLVITIFMGVSLAVAGDVKLMMKDELKSLLGSEDLVVLDVRTGRDWSSSEYKIQSAIRAPYAEFRTWSSNFDKDKTIVLYCA